MTTTFRRTIVMLAGFSFSLVSCTKGSDKVSLQSPNSSISSDSSSASSNPFGSSSSTNSQNTNTSGAGSTNTTTTVTTVVPAEINAVTTQVNNLVTQNVSLTNTLNNAIAELNALKARKVGGTMIVRYGSMVAPAGTELVTKGIAHASHYQHAGQAPQCILPKVAAEDRGEDIRGNTHPGLLYPMTTGGVKDAAYLPSDIPPGRQIVCAQIYVPGTAELFSGRSNCPDNWSLLYKGYLMTGHYSHGGAPTSPICVSNGAEFNSTIGERDLQSRVYGVMTYDTTSPGEGFPNLKFLPCAYCVKN